MSRSDGHFNSASWCTQNTWQYARVLTFFSCTVRAWLDVWLKGWTIQCVCAEVVSSLCQVSFGSSVSSVPCNLLLTNLFSDATFRLVHTADWNKKIPLHLSAVGWNECLAIWPIRLQTQVMSPSSASMSATSTRRSTSPTATGISRTTTTRQSLPPPRILMYLNTQDRQEAASTQPQRAEFPPCRNKVHLEIVSRKCWQIMIRLTVVIASGKPVQTWIEKPLFPLFLGVCVKGEGRSRSKRCAIVKRQKISTTSLSGKLNCPSEKSKWFGQKFLEAEADGGQIKHLNLSDFNHTKQVDGQIRPRETRLVCMEKWNWELESSKKIMQGIAKKLKDWEVFVAKKLIEQDKREVMN